MTCINNKLIKSIVLNEIDSRVDTINNLQEQMDSFVVSISKIMQERYPEHYLTEVIKDSLNSFIPVLDEKYSLSTLSTDYLDLKVKVAQLELRVMELEEKLPE